MKESSLWKTIGGLPAVSEPDDRKSYRPGICPAAPTAHSAQVQLEVSLQPRFANCFFSEGLPWFILP